MPRLTLATYRRIALAAVGAMGLIVVTGGAVRLTKSGLGCPTWPQCTSHSITPPWRYHDLIEFGNRVVSALVGIVTFAAVAGVFLLKERRKNLRLPAYGLAAGYLAQALIGGLSVRYHLRPELVMAHFLVSMALLFIALTLWHRAAPVTKTSTPPPTVRWLARLLVTVAALVLMAGTVVSGTGPHSGAEGVRRLPLPLRTVAMAHAEIALFFSGLLVATWFAVRLTDLPTHTRKLTNLLVALVAAQVAIGYTQYFLGVPAGLVALHIAGATALWAVTVTLNLTLADPSADELAERQRAEQQREIRDRPMEQPHRARVLPAPHAAK